jgi:hypothetical protein
MNAMRRDETRRDANDCRELIEMGTRLVRICVQAHVSWGTCLPCPVSTRLISALLDLDLDLDLDGWMDDALTLNVSLSQTIRDHVHR